MRFMPTFATFNTSEGTFKARLFDDKAPNTVANFTGLAEGTKEFTDPKTRQKATRPFYDGLVFHRVIDGFMPRSRHHTIAASSSAVATPRRRPRGSTTTSWMKPASSRSSFQFCGSMPA